MWTVVGIDDDGAEHVWCFCDSNDDAQERLEDARAQYERDVIIPYGQEIEKARIQHAETLRKHAEGDTILDKLITQDNKLLYDEYAKWKDQGCCIKEFVIEEEKEI